MRTYVLAGFLAMLAGCATQVSVTQPEPIGPAGQQWSSMSQSPRMSAYFRDTFTVLNFGVVETGEHFNLMHDGTSMSVSGGWSSKAALDVPITQAQVDAIATLAADGTLDDADAYAVMRILFAPVSRAFFTGAFLSNPIILQLAGVEDLIHITFWVDGKPDSASVTLRAEGLRWNVVDGLQGRPKRVFQLGPDDARDYMHHVFVTYRSLNPQDWIAFVNWYKQWRDKVSFVPARA